MSIMLSSGSKMPQLVGRSLLSLASCALFCLYPAVHSKEVASIFARRGANKNRGASTTSSLLSSATTSTSKRHKQKHDAIQLDEVDRMPLVLHTRKKSSSTSNVLVERSVSSLNKIIATQLISRDQRESAWVLRRAEHEDRLLSLRAETARLTRRLTAAAAAVAEAQAMLPTEEAEEDFRQQHRDEKDRCDAEEAELGKQKDRKRAELKERKATFKKYFGKGYDADGGVGGSNSTASAVGAEAAEEEETVAGPACQPYTEDELDFLVGETEDSLLSLTTASANLEEECKKRFQEIEDGVKLLEQARSRTKQQVRHLEGLRKHTAGLVEAVQRDLDEVEEEMRKEEKEAQDEIQDMKDNMCSYLEVRKEIVVARRSSKKMTRTSAAAASKEEVALLANYMDQQDGNKDELDHAAASQSDHGDTATADTATTSSSSSSPSKKIQDCELSPWKAVGFCSQECGIQGGRMKYKREIIQEGNEYGVPCKDNFELEKEAACNRSPCPIDCKVADWGPWSDCGAMCGEGSVMRERSLVQAAQWNGKVCPRLQERQPCSAGPCNKDCVVADTWSKPTACSRACGGGSFEQSRAVVAQALGTTGECPVTKYRKLEACNVEACLEEVLHEEVPSSPSTTSTITAKVDSTARTSLSTLGSLQGLFRCGERNLVVLIDKSGSMVKSSVVGNVVSGDAFMQSLDKALSNYTVDSEKVRLARIDFGTQARLMAKTTRQHSTSPSTSSYSSTSTWSTSSSRIGNSTRVSIALHKARDTLQEIHSSRAAAKVVRERELNSVPGGLALATRFGVRMKLDPPRGKDVVIIFSDGIWARKHAIREAIEKLRGDFAADSLSSSSARLLLVGSDATALERLQGEKWVSPEHVFEASDMVNILSGVCEARV
ncbi:unnamed protein product [Amoebophrya sp. A25]|nr:unnamed protein product [Amoebophrya sp. A25]|eukprot:GSA25T00006492001.1